VTGPEHYRKAEGLMRRAASVDYYDLSHGLMMAAQVHATLALAAATALPPGGPDSASRGKWVMAVSEL
jgi:hypothetical protein